MSTGSPGSSPEDYGPRHRRIAPPLERSARKGTCFNRCSEKHLDDAREERRASTAHAQKDSRQTQRNAANARERARMRVLSKAFSRLKTSLPWVPADTKLSKLDTLRLASSYISHLRQLLQEERLEGFSHPVNLRLFCVSADLALHDDRARRGLSRSDLHCKTLRSNSIGQKTRTFYN